MREGDHDDGKEAPGLQATWRNLIIKSLKRHIAVERAKAHPSLYAVQLEEGHLMK
jgi:hypothetical protein